MPVLDVDHDRIDSLPTDQVSLLLRTLALHRDLLQAAHQDAKRLILGARPCYLLDYQLLHNYMYQEREFSRNPEALVEFWHLLQQTDVSLIIGHGTTMEVLFMVQRTTGIHLPLLDSVTSYEGFTNSFPLLAARFDDSVAQLLHEAPEHGRAVVRLRGLLEHPNLRRIWQIEKDLNDKDVWRAANAPYRSVLDRDAYHAALAVLSQVPERRSRSYSNAADAANFADVVGLRSAFEAGVFSDFPFLLTDTQPMLDERRWARDRYATRWGYGGEITRNPLTAIYSDLCLPEEGTQAERIATKTVDLAFEAAQLERDLRRSRGYKTDVSIARNSWEAIAAGRRIADQFVEQLALLSSFLGDPIISESQRIYDNSRLAAANWIAQEGGSRPTDSPRKVFDAILDMSKVLAQPGREIRGLWDSVIERQVDRTPHWTTISYHRKGEPGLGLEIDEDIPSPYLEVERHEDSTVFRWSTRAGAESLLQAFSKAFQRHEIHAVDFFAGTEIDAVEFDATIPVTLEDLRQGMQEAEKVRAAMRENAQPVDVDEDGAHRVGPGEVGPHELGQVLWVRMNSKEFDLYGELIPCRPGVDPIAGISVGTVDRAHLIELYWATSSRFLFGSWLDAILNDSTQDTWMPREGEVTPHDAQ